MDGSRSRWTTWAVGALLAGLVAAALIVHSMVGVAGDWGQTAAVVVQAVFGLVAVILWGDPSHRATAVLLAGASVCIAGALPASPTPPA